MGIKLIPDYVNIDEHCHILNYRSIDMFTIAYLLNYILKSDGSAEEEKTLVIKFNHDQSHCLNLKIQKYDIQYEENACSIG